MLSADLGETVMGAIRNISAEIDMLITEDLAALAPVGEMASF